MCRQSIGDAVDKKVNNMKVITCVPDLRDMARAKLPRVMFDFAQEGAHDQVTARVNRHDFAAIQFRQRVGIDVSTRSKSTTMLGQECSLPLALAPVGLTGLFHGNGEILAARAAHKFGVPFALSSMSVCSIEDVHEAVPAPFWFMVVVMRDRGFTKSLIERAIAAKCSALIVAMDLPSPSQHHRNVKNGMCVPPRLTLKNVVDVLTKPRWALGCLFGKRHTYGNLQGLNVPTGLNSLISWLCEQWDPSLTWRDIEWIRSMWPGKLVLKGLLDAEDAAIAAKVGADAIIVSNHGGRQLDGAPSSISVLPEVVDAVGGKLEVLLDSGIESGHDVLKALALGARGCLIGKAYIFGLAAMGETGVTKVLELIRKELDICMALTGVSDIRKVNSDILYMPREALRLSEAAKAMAAR